MERRVQCSDGNHNHQQPYCHHHHYHHQYRHHHHHQHHHYHQSHHHHQQPHHYPNDDQVDVKPEAGNSTGSLSRKPTHLSKCYIMIISSKKYQSSYDHIVNYDHIKTYDHMMNYEEDPLTTLLHKDQACATVRHLRIGNRHHQLN